MTEPKPPSVEQLEERERCAAICDALGDAVFAAIAKKQNIGFATIAQKHYIACAKAIREQGN